MSAWVEVVHAAQCVTCECCDEPFCETHKMHYADCECVGPCQDDEYEYNDDQTKARKLKEPA